VYSEDQLRRLEENSLSTSYLRLLLKEESIGEQFQFIYVGKFYF
jgi:hypothetical protein